jgi:hypothetical protein
MEVVEGGTSGRCRPLRAGSLGWCRSSRAGAELGATRLSREEAWGSIIVEGGSLRRCRRRSRERA